MISQYVAPSHTTPSQTGLSLWQRLRMAWMIVMRRHWRPKIRFDNGVELDFDRHAIVMNHPTQLHCKENFSITTNKNLILESGRTPDPERPGYVYAIWENCDRDHQGRPILVAPNTTRKRRTSHK